MLQLDNLAGLRCRKRIADQQFDDPPKVVPPPPEKQKVVVELDDKRSSKVHTHLQGEAEGCNRHETWPCALPAQRLQGSATTTPAGCRYWPNKLPSCTAWVS